ncbi:CRISPR-associated ramp protein [Candidatus Magnetomorum sp. HK-1]|nr:CRISPR-associated ramp protein [Candidatus Magnetomorum sp. HK-1]
MPVNEEFWNPYRMISVREDTKNKKAPLTDEKFVGHSGHLTCSLTNLTPLFIGGNRDDLSDKNRTFLTRTVDQTKKYVIPGTSLKGVLRSLAEIIGKGCMITQSTCKKINMLCIACRMFGMMEKGTNARVHKGKVSISDAILQEEPSCIPFQVYMDSCKDRHEPFYRTQETGRYDQKSRKLYFHQPKRKESVSSLSKEEQQRSWIINALKINHHFEFSVQFSNLTEKELSLLVYILALENNVSAVIETGNIKLKGPLCHKIGNAKPLGLGSCHIQIKKLVLLGAAENRFSSLKNTHDKSYTGDALESKINLYIKDFVSDHSPGMQQLRKMMIWDKTDERLFKYPGYHWFRNPENSQKSLKHI